MKRALLLLLAICGLANVAAAGVPPPVNPSDPTPKSYVDTALSNLQNTNPQNWLNASAAAATFTSQANNLSDLANVAAARTNLGLSAPAIAPFGTVTGDVADAGWVSQIANRTLDPRTYGGKCDNNSHPLNTVYASLAAAQIDFPFATSPTQELDWAAAQKAIYTVTPNVTLPGITEALGARLINPHPGCIWGSSPIVANGISLDIEGEGHAGSTISDNGDFIYFGLSNGMSVGTSSVGSTGYGFSIGSPLSINNLICTGTLPVLTVTATDLNGSLTAPPSVTNPGSQCTPISNPVTVTDISGNVQSGSGASLNLTYSNGTVAGDSFAGTGLAYSNGDVLTANGGTNVTRPAVFKVTNEVSGIIQPGGYVVIDPGAYGTPPPNPVSFQGGTGTGASFNFGSFGNPGGSLELGNVKFIQTGAGGVAVTAQHDIAAMTDYWHGVSFDKSSSSAYWTKLASIRGASNVTMRDVNANNNLNVGGVQVGDAGIEFIEQNNLVGRYQFYVDTGNILGFGDCLRWIQNSNNPIQGIYVGNVSCVQGKDYIHLLNNGTAALAQIVLHDDQSQNDGFFVDAQTKIVGIFGNHNKEYYGRGATLAPPSVCGMYNFPLAVNQAAIDHNNITVSKNNGCLQAYFVNSAGSNGTYDHNEVNTGLGLAMTGYNFLPGSVGNHEDNDLFGAGVTQIVDAGVNNITMNSPQIQSFGSSIAFKTMSGIQAYITDYNGYPRFAPSLSAGGYGLGAQITVNNYQPPIAFTTCGDTPAGSTSLTLCAANSLIHTTMSLTGPGAFQAGTTIKSISGTAVTFFPATATGVDLPDQSAATASEYQSPLKIFAPAGSGIVDFGAHGEVVQDFPATNGGTIQIPDGVTGVNVTGPLVAGEAIDLPPNPYEGLVIHFQAYGGITALTLGVFPGSGQQLGAAPSTLTPSAPFAEQFHSLRWQRCAC